MRDITCFQTMPMNKKLFSDNNRDKNHQIGPRNVTHTICRLNYKLFSLTIQSFRENKMCPRGMNNS